MHRMSAARSARHRLVRELGRGGMGTVYLAERADGAFDHDVAVKVTEIARVRPSVARRFQPSDRCSPRCTTRTSSR